MATRKTGSPSIHKTIQIPHSPGAIFEFWTSNAKVAEFMLALRANVTATVGGPYEVFWDKSGAKDSTEGCRVIAAKRNELIAFEWKGPTRFKPFGFMNEGPTLTHVTIALVPSTGTDAELTTIHLVHSGFGSGDKWDLARAYFDEAWGIWLKTLKLIMTKPQKLSLRITTVRIKRLSQLNPVTAGPIIEAQN
jgi:uncharacterized protein YndB with AHSA1/START domain